MKLKALLQDVETKSVYTINPEIKWITDSTDKVRQGTAFVCVEGDTVDGHSFAFKALEKGAEVIICRKDLGIERSVIVEDTRKAYALMCAAFYGNCHKKMKMIAVTGTNGKTTTACMLRSVLEGSGYKTGLIGTVSVIIGKERYPADLTTPDPADLHRYLMMMSIAGCDACVMEVSSQALSQQRVYGIDFDVSVFTNLSAEHLDYHKDMKSYALAKASLFGQSKCAVINSDDDYSVLMKRKCHGKTLTYGTLSDAQIRAENINVDRNGIRYTLVTPESSYPVGVNMMGGFNAYNSAAALSVAYLLGADMNRAVRSMSEFDGIRGRMEKLENKLGINVIIDFAHTPDSLENALKTVREIYDGRIITVFGCGGDRDKSKRNIMGKTAYELSDKVFVTSDNPRTEKPEAIIEEITAGLPTDRLFKITDRTQALKSALNCAKEGDVVLVAGKGHEKYQILGTQKIFYDEREIIRKLLEDKARF